MSRFGVVVMGPAGAGKTTFCTALIEYLKTNKRSCFYINLDPAAQDFTYEPDIDIKELISLGDVMEEMDLGPNGGLIFCFEYLLENMDFLTEPLESVTEDYMIIIDMPGQIELYTHVPIIPRLTKELTEGSLNTRLCAAYLLESTFIVDRAKFFAGTLSAMSAMLMLGIPHVNILSKMDLVKGTVTRKELRKFIAADADLMEEPVPDAQRLHFQDQDEEDEEASADPAATENVMGGASFNALNKTVARLIDDYGLVSFLQLDAQNEDSVAGILSYIDDAVQFHESQEPTEPRDEVEWDMGD